MTRFLRLPLSLGQPEDATRYTISIEHIKYFYLAENRVVFILTLTPIGNNKLEIYFQTIELASEYYNKLTEYFEITI